MTVSNGLSQTPWWRSDPAELGGGCKRALERTVFPKGRLQPLAGRALLGGLGPRACKRLCRGLSFGSAAPGGTDRGRGACHWLPGGGASCLLVPPREPSSREEKAFRARRRARSLRCQERGSKGPSLVGSQDRKDRTTTTLPDPGANRPHDNRPITIQPASSIRENCRVVVVNGCSR
jgi:hypothetical protein